MLLKVFHNFVSFWDSNFSCKFDETTAETTTELLIASRTRFIYVETFDVIAVSS